MAGNLPIRFQELLQLSQVGIQEASVGFATLSMESEKYICVRETTGQTTNVVIIDMENPSQPIRRPISADAAVMNPTLPILALKAGQTLQMWSIEEKKPVKRHQMTDAVTFWKWVDQTCIALVTGTAVYHWSLEGESPPVKVFDRKPELSDCQIINYRANTNHTWLSLVGISQQDGRIVGSMQLYSTEKKASQLIEGQACDFGEFLTPGASGKTSTMFAFAARKAAESKLYVIEVSQGDSGQAFQKIAVDIYFPPEAGADFPVAMQISEKYEVIFMVTKFGFVHVFDLGSGALIYRNRISSDTIFVTAPHNGVNGIIGVNKKGQVLLVTINEETIVQYCTTQLKNPGLALKIAGKHGLGGADEIFVQQFNQVFATGDYKSAANIAAKSPKEIIRNAQTIQKFQQLPQKPNEPPPLLQYFGTLLEIGKLNSLESLELTRLVLAQGRKPLLEKWLTDDKLECTEQLGDEVKPHDLKMALSIYYRAEASAKVIQCFAETGDFDKIAAYSAKVGENTDYNSLFQQMLQSGNGEGALKFTMELLTGEGSPKMDVNYVVDSFLQYNMIQETNKLLLEVLKGNKPEEGALQTKLLEINLVNARDYADAILGNEMFTHYNRVRIAQLCEKAGLFQRALEHYTDLADIRRVLLNTHALDPQFLVGFFGKLEDEDRLSCLQDLLRSNINQNLQLVVDIAAKYGSNDPNKFIEMFETFESQPKGLFYFLQKILPDSTDKHAHFKYIEAAAKLGQYQEVEKIVRESDHYDAEEVRDFLKEAKLPDALPLIIVCDKNEFIDDLTKYLYKNNMSKYIEAYVQQINPVMTPLVVGALLDVDCPEDYVKNLVLSVRGLCPIDPLVEEVEKRNRLRLILPWIEGRIQEGSQETALHNALAKINIDMNNDSEHFLTTNPFYDSKVLGVYCENRDPYLAYVAYKRGQCDYEVIELTNKHSLFKHQARYLVERQDEQLWAFVLSDENEFKKQCVEQVVQTALPETKNVEDVSATVKAFMQAKMPNELIDLLDKIVLESNNTQFSENKSLQNLLILTAMRSDTSRVMDYVTRLNNYEADNIADIAIETELYEEAFVIYKKSEINDKAISVLIKYIDSIDRAADFANVCNQPEVYSKLGEAQLTKDLLHDAIESFIKADDPQFFELVIACANRVNDFTDLVKYLEMCKKKTRDVKIESELVYAFAKTDRLADLEEFITGPNCAQIQNIGDRCFDEGLYSAAKILFNNISNFPRLASALVKLKEYNSAVDAARKASSTRTWKEVCFACVDAEEFKMAQICGQHIIIHADELESLVHHYEKRGRFEEVMTLLESSLGLERSHVGMFTELAILFSNYKPEKLMEHLKIFYSRINIPKVLRITQQNQQWSEVALLHIHYDEHDNAAMCMISHSADAWDHVLFKEVIQKVSNPDICYNAVQFYIEEQPLLVNDLLTVLATRVDHSKVVSRVQRLGHTALIKPYLISVQEHDIPAVNESLNRLYIEEEDFETLRVSVDGFQNFDSISLAAELERHELLEFRRLAAYLYKRNKRFSQSIDLSKKDKLYQDAMETAADSKDKELAETLLIFFVDEIKSKECFAACLYSCYDLIRPDVALELAWKNQFQDFAYPYLIQVLREYTEKVDDLIEASKPSENPDDGKPDSFQVQGMVMGGIQGVPMLPGTNGEGMFNPGMGMPMGGGMMPGMMPGMGQF